MENNGSIGDNIRRSAKVYDSLMAKARSARTEAEAEKAMRQAEIWRRFTLEPMTMNYSSDRQGEGGGEPADFSGCAEPFAMGNMLIFRKPEGLEYEVSVNGGEWSRGVFTVGKDGCTARTRTKITIGWGKEYEPELWYASLPEHQDYWEEAGVEPPAPDNVVECVSPTKSFSKDRHYPYYSWAYRMFNTYRSWQQYEMSQERFGTFREFMDFIVSDWTKFNETVFQWQDYKWAMPIVFASWQDMPESDEYRRAVEGSTSCGFVTPVFDDAVKVYMPSVLSCFENTLGREVLEKLKEGLKKGIDSDANVVFGLPTPMPDNWRKPDGSPLQPDEELFVFSDYYKALIEFMETIPSGQRFQILRKVAHGKNFRKETKGAYYKNDAIADILANVGFGMYGIWQGHEADLDWCEKEIDDSFAYWMVQYTLYAVACLDTGEDATAWKMLDEIRSIFYIPDSYSTKDLLSITCYRYGVIAECRIDLLLYGYGHLLKSCVKEYFNPVLPEWN